MLQKVKDELTILETEIEELNIQKKELDNQVISKMDEIRTLSDSSANIQSTLIQKNRIKSELEIVEKWLSEKETIIET